ncbi:MAG: bifunctional phosphopantothenoylcysteine decarboxylase/phosphopantothenate--cysteine ligase CoaBC, partial [Micrococcales bacterium]|nr:bifunctional phosphopantothenoylcysteine decarboxylase/phosphopantothenate--cysteine ligase CoaBC [Micrococcales bacterium]
AREAGHDVRVVPTPAALRFVGAPTWAALSGEPVAELFDDVEHVGHIEVGRTADLVIVAPATADLLARAAAGQADDLLTAALLVATCPVLMAPAMHTQMWQHPATVANVATLRARGVHIIDPDDGRLTGADSGPGRLPDPEAIMAAALRLTGPRDLAGRRVVISAGGTQEPLDPVRFLGNRSSGRQGVALARAAAERGADVLLVAANMAVAPPPGVEVRTVTTAVEMHTTMLELAPDADVIIMAAAVADFRPADPSPTKIKKTGSDAVTIELVQNPDILAALASTRPSPAQLVIGFAAETGDDTASVLDHARTKAARKGADLLVVNPVDNGRGFGTPDNEITIVDSSGAVITTAHGTKDAVAHTIWDVIAERTHR